MRTVIAAIFFATILCQGWALTDLPQVKTLGAGFDAVQGQTKVPIIALSYSSNTWINPFGNSTVYSVPDEVYVANRYGMITNNNIYYTSSNYSETVAQEYGIGFDKLGNWFKPQVQAMETALDKDQKTYSTIGQHLTMFQATLTASKPLVTDSFKEAIASIPETYDYERIKSFFQFTGTHVIVDILVGGKSEFQTYADSKFLSYGTGFLLGGNAQVQFGIEKSEFGGQYSRSKTSDSFAQYSEYNYVRLGGNPDIPKEDWRSWVKTVPTNPIVLRQKLVPITEFIDDPVKKGFIERALQMYSSKSAQDPQNKKQNIATTSCNCETVNLPNACPNGKVVTVSNSYNGWASTSIQCCTPCTSWPQNAFGAPFFAHNRDTSRSLVLKEEKIRSQKLFEQKRRLINSVQRDSGLSKCGAFECLPGLDSFGVGFDALSGEIRNIGFFDWTFRSRNNYSDPFDKSISYSYPDQVNLESAPSTRSSTKMFKSSTEYLKQLSADAGLEFDFPFFGLSSEVKFAQSVFTGQQAVFFQKKEEIGFYALTLPPPTQLTFSKALQEALAGLPNHLDYAAYASFVNKFGTHFVSKSLYGGRIKLNSYVDTFYAKQQDEASLIAKVNLMMQAFKLDFAANVTNSYDFSSFTESSFSEVYLEGGNFEDFQIQDYSQWKDSVHFAPIQISYSLSPISSLVLDPKKKSFLDAYLMYYYNKITVPQQQSITFQLQNVAPIVSSNPDCRQYGSESVCYNSLTSGFKNSNNAGYWILPVYCLSFNWRANPGDRLHAVDYECSTLPQGTFRCPVNQFISAFSCASTITNYYAVSPITCCKMSLKVEQSSMFVATPLPPSPPYTVQEPVSSDQQTPSNSNFTTYMLVGGGCVGLICLVIAGILLHKRMKKRTYQELN